MKALLFATGILATAAAMSTRAEAQNYPWCAYYGGDFGGENCGFVSFEQCMATLSGIGGFCDRNTQYVPAAGATRNVHRPRRRRHP
jgi:hypothetical protein